MSKHCSGRSASTEERGELLLHRPAAGRLIRDLSQYVRPAWRSPPAWGDSTGWEDWVIDVVKRHEDERGYEPHPMGMTMQFPVSDQTRVNEPLLRSRAEWTSPG